MLRSQTQCRGSQAMRALSLATQTNFSFLTQGLRSHLHGLLCTKHPLIHTKVHNKWLDAKDRPPEKPESDSALALHSCKPWELHVSLVAVCHRDHTCIPQPGPRTAHPPLQILETAFMTSKRGTWHSVPQINKQISRLMD
jgi:hypothetical protein